MDVHDAGVATDHIARARKLAPLLTAAAPRIDKARELPGDVLDAMHANGMFRLLVPRSLRRRRIGSSYIHPMRRSNRRRRCLCRLVHESGLRLLAVGSLPGACRRP